MKSLINSLLCGAALLLFESSVSFAETSPPRWDADRFVTIEGSLQDYVFTQAEVEAARQRLAQFISDRSELFEALHAETIHSLPANLRESSPVRALIDRAFAEVDLQFSELDRSTKQLPDQALVVLTIQGHAAIEGTALLARSLRESPGSLPWLPRVDPLLPFAKVAHPSCGTVQTSEEICSYESPAGCKARDFGTCIKVSEGFLGFFVTADAATPNDIMLLAFGSGVNIPSPLKVAVNLLLYLAKVGGQIGECYLDGTSECSYAQALSFLQDENRWASDFELADAKQQIQAAIGSGSSDISSKLQTLGTLTSTTLNRLAREDGYASDSEMFSSIATLQSQIAGLSDLSCHLEELARLPQSERGAIPPHCESTSTSPSRATARRAPASRKFEPDRERLPRTIETLQLELDLLGPPPSRTVVPTTARLADVKQLVWETIRAFRRLAIAPSATANSEQSARRADRLMLAGQNQRAFEVYQAAYRVLVAGE